MKEQNAKQWKKIQFFWEDVIFKSVVNYGIPFSSFVTVSSSTQPLAAAPGGQFLHVDARLIGSRQRANMGENTNTVLKVCQS